MKNIKHKSHCQYLRGDEQMARHNACVTRRAQTIDKE